MRKRISKKKKNIFTSYDIWIKSDKDDNNRKKYNNPDCSIIAKSASSAVFQFNLTTRLKNVMTFKPTETTEKDAVYATRPSKLKSPRYLTFWK